MRSSATLVRVAVVVGLGLGLTTGNAEAQHSAVDWWSFTTGINHNGQQNLWSDPKFFAEIRLTIRLTDADRDSVGEFAWVGNVGEVQRIMGKGIGDLNDEGRAANQRIIDSISLRPRDMPELRPGDVPGIRPERIPLLGIDWVNIEEGTDFSGDPRGVALAPPNRPPMFFARVHLMIPLTSDMKTAIESFMEQRLYDSVRAGLTRALERHPQTDRVENKRLVAALRFRGENPH